MEPVTVNAVVVVEQKNTGSGALCKLTFTLNAWIGAPICFAGVSPGKGFQDSVDTVAMLYEEELRNQSVEASAKIEPPWDKIMGSSPLTVGGDSWGAAMAVGLEVLLRGYSSTNLDSILVTAAINGEGKLADIGGLESKIQPITAPGATLTTGIRHLIVHEGQLQKALECQRRAGATSSRYRLNIVGASDINALLQIIQDPPAQNTQQIIEAWRPVVHKLIARLEKESIFLLAPMGFGKSTLSELLVAEQGKQNVLYHFVDAQSSNSREGLISALCARYRELYGEDAEEKNFTERLKEKGATRLILDGFDHLQPDTQAWVLQLIDGLPEMRALVTARAWTITPEQLARISRRFVVKEGDKLFTPVEYRDAVLVFLTHTELGVSLGKKGLVELKKNPQALKSFLVAAEVASRFADKTSPLALAMATEQLCWLPEKLLSEHVNDLMGSLVKCIAKAKRPILNTPYDLRKILALLLTAKRPLSEAEWKAWSDLAMEVSPTPKLIELFLEVFKPILHVRNDDRSPITFVHPGYHDTLCKLDLLIHPKGEWKPDWPMLAWGRAMLDWLYAFFGGSAFEESVPDTHRYIAFASSIRDYGMDCVAEHLELVGEKRLARILSNIFQFYSDSNDPGGKIRRQRLILDLKALYLNRLEDNSISYIGGTDSFIELTYKPAMNCMDCQHKRVIDDPDPYDWFHDFYVAVVCSKVVNPECDTASRYRSDHSEYRVIASVIDPFDERRKCDAPDWCPLNERDRIKQRFSIQKEDFSVPNDYREEVFRYVCSTQMGKELGKNYQSELERLKNNGKSCHSFTVASALAARYANQPLPKETVIELLCTLPEDFQERHVTQLWAHAGLGSIKLRQAVALLLTSKRPLTKSEWLAWCKLAIIEKSYSSNLEEILTNYLDTFLPLFLDCNNCEGKIIFSHHGYVQAVKNVLATPIRNCWNPNWPTMAWSRAMQQWWPTRAADPELRYGLEWAPEHLKQAGKIDSAKLQRMAGRLADYGIRLAMNCLYCPHHDVIDTFQTAYNQLSDLDSYKTVLCKKMQNLEPKPKGFFLFRYGYSEFRAITKSYAPDNKDRCCATPEWCPLNEKEKRHIAHLSRQHAKTEALRLKKLQKNS